MPGTKKNLDMADIYLAQIDKLCASCSQVLQEQINDLKEKNQDRIPGHLNKSSCNGYVRWRKVLSAAESQTGKEETHYLAKSDEGTRNQLASQLFGDCSLRVKEVQLLALQCYQRKIDRIDKMALRITKDEDILKLVGQAGNDALHQALMNWQNSDYVHNPNHPENLNIHAVGGRMVRSKSEATIASELYSMDVPFRYECAFQVGNKTIYPDFSIRHPVTGKLFLWEHLGMMDDTAYAAAAARKLSLYIQEGYIPGINLIITSESRAHPLDFRYVRMLVHYYFELS